MQRWRTPDEIPDDLGRTVVTLGTFDGVHRGHTAVLSALVERARAAGAQAVAVTFDPHPLAVLRPESCPDLITSTSQRLDLLEQAGLDGVLVMEFTRDLAAWSPEEFVRQVFVDALACVCVVVGADTRFGHRNSGDVDTLRVLGEQHGFDVVTIDDVGDDTGTLRHTDATGAGVPDGDSDSAADTDTTVTEQSGTGDDGHVHRWSSTLVRELLADGDVAHAADLLGRGHRVSGVVVHGHHRGRGIGYPTANLEQDSDGLVPADGVYAGWLHRPELASGDPDAVLPSAISVGSNPTFDGVVRTVEAYVLDRTDLDLYDERVVVEFVEHLRPMLRFDSVEELIERMAEDVDQARSILTARRSK